MGKWVLEDCAGAQWGLDLLYAQAFAPGEEPSTEGFVPKIVGAVRLAGFSPGWRILQDGRVVYKENEGKRG